MPAPISPLALKCSLPLGPPLLEKLLLFCPLFFEYLLLFLPCNLLPLNQLLQVRRIGYSVGQRSLRCLALVGIQIVIVAGDGIGDRDHPFRIALRNPFADLLQSLLNSGAPFAIAIVDHLIPLNDLITVAKSLNGLSDCGCRIRRSFDQSAMGV